jgi:hypothetical protein
VYILSGRRLWLAAPGWAVAAARAGMVPAIGVLWGVGGLLRFSEHHNTLGIAAIFLGVVVRVPWGCTRGARLTCAQGDTYNTALIVYFLRRRSRGSGRRTCVRMPPGWRIR